MNMASIIPDSHRDLFEDEKRAFAFLGTSMKDGSPHVTPVWFDMRGDEMRLNSARGRVKDRNITARPKVSLAIMDPDDSYRYIHIRGTVVEITEDGAREHIDLLAKKYLGEDKYPWYGGEVRVTYIARIDRVRVMP
jgi:PPOX class probable F420-dependent enzyme